MTRFLEAFRELREEEALHIAGVAEDKYAYLAKSVQNWMDGWPAQSTGTDTLRASGLYFCCPREFVLNYWQPHPNNSFDWTSQLRMSMGTHLHSFFQNCVLGPMGILIGDWLKIVDGDPVSVSYGAHPEPAQAVYEVVHQKPLTWVYRENRVWDEHTRIAGHIDGVMARDAIDLLWKSREAEEVDWRAVYAASHEDPKLLMNWELKTVGQRVFDRMKTSSDIADYYKVQANVYMKLAGTRQTLFWLVNRDTMQSKMLVYEFEPRWWKEAQRKARIIWRSIRDETLPDSMMACKLPTDRRAKSCTHRDACWKRKLDFAAYVEKGKADAEEAGRKLLDLSKWTEDDHED